MNTIFGATFVGHWFEEVLSANCSRETVGGEMLAGKGLARCARTAHDCCWRDNQTRAWSREKRVFALA